MCVCVYFQLNNFPCSRKRFRILACGLHINALPQTLSRTNTEKRRRSEPDRSFDVTEHKPSHQLICCPKRKRKRAATKTFNPISGVIRRIRIFFFSSFEPQPSKYCVQHHNQYHLCISQYIPI